MGWPPRPHRDGGRPAAPDPACHIDDWRRDALSQGDLTQPAFLRRAAASPLLLGFPTSPPGRGAVGGFHSLGYREVGQPDPAMHADPKQKRRSQDSHDEVIVESVEDADYHHGDEAQRRKSGSAPILPHE